MYIEAYTDAYICGRIQRSAATAPNQDETMTQHPIVTAIEAAGFSPFNPSSECRETLKRPPMPADLSPLDRLGIHSKLLMMDALTRFPDYTEPEGTDLNLALGWYTILHAIAHEGGDPQDRALFSKTLTELTEWKCQRLDPAAQRMDEQPEGDLLPRAACYEPAWTLERLKRETW